MPFNYTPSKSKVYLPKMGAYQSAWNERNKALFTQNTRAFGAPQQFQQPEGNIFVEGGRAGIKGGDLLSDLIRAPGHMLESPFRLPNVLSGGAIGNAVANIYQGAKQTPVIGQGLGLVEGAVGILDIENKAARATLNQGLAGDLKESIGKMPDEMINTKQWGNITVGDFRRRIQNMWSVNEFTGEAVTLEQLEQIASQNEFGFGEFRVDENGIVGFVKEMFASPSTYLLGTGLVGRGLGLIGDAARLIGGAERTAQAVKAASWARAVPATLSRYAGLPRVGRGAQEAIRGAVRIVPENAAVQAFLKSPPGRLGSLTLGGLLKAGQKALFPGYAALRRPSARQLGSNLDDFIAAGGRTGAGMGRGRAAFVSYQRGGLQQMAALSGAEHLVNAVNERQYDEDGGATTPSNGFSDSLHDLLHAVNNNHPLSNSSTYTVLALFSPWPAAVSEAWRGTRNIRGAKNPQRYYNNSVAQQARTLGELTGRKFKSEEEFIAEVAKFKGGDEKAARAAIEYAIDFADALLVNNQQSGFANGVISTIEGKIHRSNFMSKLVGDGVARRRYSGALHPKSNSEMLIRLYREGFGGDEIRLNQGKRSISVEGFAEFIATHHDGQLFIADRLGPAAGIIAAQGQTITREIMDGIRGMLDQLPADEVIPRSVASLIIEKHPWLMHQTEFWQEFSITLGQKLDKTGLTKGRAALPEGTEGITVGELREYVDEFYETLAPESELFHEQEAAQRQALQAGQVREVIDRSVSPNMPARMAAYRDRFVTASRHAMDVKKKIAKIKSAEFNRNGTAKFASAKTLKGHFGGVFKRSRQSNTFLKEPTGPDLSFPRLPNRNDGLIDVLNQYTPDPNDPNMVRRPEVLAREAKIVTMGDRDYHLIRPVDGAMYTAQGNKLEFLTGGKGMDLNKWYIYDDLTGKLSLKRGFRSEKEALSYLRKKSDLQVSLTIKEGVIDIKGKIIAPNQNDVMPRALAESFEDNYADILDTIRNTWDMYRGRGPAGQRRETPHTIIAEESKNAMLPSMSTKKYYYIGDDGKPAGILSIDMNKWGAQHINVYVDPAYRGPQLNVGNQLYDRAFRDGIDLSQVSGVSNTPAGRRFTDKYWANRRDSLDTEALQLGVEHGGRIMERPVEFGGRAADAETLARWGFHEVARYKKERFPFKPSKKKAGTVKSDNGVQEIPVSEQHNVKVGDTEYTIFKAASDSKETRYARVSDPEDPMFGEIEKFDQNYKAGKFYVKPLNSPDHWMLNAPYQAHASINEVREFLVGSETDEVAVFAYRGGDTTQAIINSRVEGANRPYTPTTRTVNTRNAAMNLARKRANDASLVYPTLDTLGQGYSNSRTFFSPEERRLHLTELMDNLDAQAKSGAESIQFFDDTVNTITGLKKVTSLDSWFERALPEEINSLVTTVKDLNRDFPGLQLQEGQMFVDPRQERYGHLQATHSILGRMSFDYGFLSPISRFFDMLEPTSSTWIAKEARHELETQMTAVGLTTKQIDKFYDGIRETIQRSRSAEGAGSLIGSYEYRNSRAIPEGMLRGILRDAAGEAGEKAVLGRFGSVHRMITEASSGVLRRSSERARMGGRVGRVEAAVNNFARFWQYDPAMRGLSGATHWTSKFLYPLLRFRTDPLFVAMNMVEPYMYGISRHGINNALRKRSRYQQTMNERVFRESQRSSIPAGGLTDVENLPIEILLQDSGMFTMPRNIKNPMLGDYEVMRIESLMDELKAIPETDPLAIILQERFGKMSGDNWARGMEDVMFGFMDESVEGMTRTQFKEYFDELGFTADELQQMTPFVNRIAEKYRGLADDVVDLYVGRMRRSTVERVMDNFWLFWPMSYIIKATTWLASIMFKRVGGVNMGAGGAYLYTEYRDRFLRAVENDPDMQAWLEENRDFMFLFEMLFPLTPESIGISMNPGTRIAASWLNANTINSPDIQNLFGDFSYIESVPEAIERTLRFGPVRSWNLWKRLAGALEVPGWTYGEGSSGPVPLTRGDRLPSFGGLAASTSDAALSP